MTPVDKLVELIEPIVLNAELELYHIEYVRQGGENYLRIYIDSENNISLADCEKVSRPVSEMLDIEDPIKEGYCLEVSSPGIFRGLYNDKHLLKYNGEKISVKLNCLLDGRRKFEGILKGFNETEILIQCDGNEISIPREKISSTSLKGEI